MSVPEELALTQQALQIAIDAKEKKRQMSKAPFVAQASGSSKQLKSEHQSLT